MSQSRWMTRGALAATAVAVTALIAGCGGGTSGSPSPAGSSGSITTTAHPSGTAAPTSGARPGPVPITDELGKQLCDALAPQLSDWRVQGPTLGRVALNITVHEWAVRNGGINMQVLADKPVVDRITEKNCATVRAEALRALELQDLASGIAF
ncbi:hypothetical protein NDR87_08240 [Nocardia sp. CDC159]|uniref:Lipoprotein n=1 Tax=Nocardia pulmonis TaxID=2951408 RepID=A0A9X2E5Z9_9NOCA|nr:MULTISPECIES: hypothetical protein [Nocardia]MCM6773460.1 hypothetical protein [Nocardia pulmonis]MCM6786347.1 hypothetical protein [Nocardia sp. CDC159]